MSCRHPITVMNKLKQNVAAPCGKCVPCLNRRVDDWAFRLINEAKVSDSSMFVTLTYVVPPMSENGFMTLDKSDLQRFFKRLRKTTSKKIKYYAVGEYGGRTNRPHYHLILFNAKQQCVLDAWTNFLPAIYGHVHFGNVSTDSISYCTKYFAKEKRIPMFQRDDRIKEFSLMSKYLGISYLEKASTYHSNGLVGYVTLPGGFKKPLPKYYRDKIFSDAEKEEMKARIRAPDYIEVPVCNIEREKELFFKTVNDKKHKI